MNKFFARRDFIKKSLLAVPALGSFPDSTEALQEKITWAEINGKTYGARPDKNGPIGGGAGYSKIITKGDYEVDDLDGLINALAKAKAGEVVFIKGEAEIDLTVDIYIDEFFLSIPAGVTLAGNRGHNGSAGPVVTSDTIKTPQMFKVTGDGVRITGLRIKGPNPKRQMRHHRRSFSKDGLGREHYYKFPTSNGIICEGAQLEVDNCEITAFGHAGIYLKGGTGHHIHHNYIHHCQYHGLGYGISHATSSSLIEYNQFDSNRHSIAGTGAKESEYIARHNVELGVASSHCFDMHGGRDRKDGTNIAGKKIEVYNNTFFVPDQHAVVIRGEPVDKCNVFQNWFPFQTEVSQVVRGESKTRTFDNLFGKDDKKII